MSLLSKRATARRVQAAIGTSAVPGTDQGPWRATGRLVADAIIRQAALKLSLAGTRSDSNRGRANIISSAILSSSTIMFIETSDTAVWRVTLGSITVDGELAIDWQSKIIHGNGEVEVRTPQYLTVDGTLKHGGLHDEFRRNVLAALATGEAGSRTEESEISIISLETAQVTETLKPTGECQDSFRFETMKPAERVRQIVGSMGFPLLTGGLNDWRFGLGLPDSWPDNWVRLTLDDPGNKRVLDGTITLSGTRPRTDLVMATHAAGAAFRRLKSFLSFEEPDIAIAAPSFIALDH